MEKLLNLFAVEEKARRVYGLPVLSGSAHVGQLYDARTEKLLYERFLWKNPIAVNEAMITRTKTETYIEENLRDRVSHMAFSAEIKFTIMGIMSVSNPYLSQCILDLHNVMPVS